MIADSAWHILHGDWEPVATPQRDALLARLGDRLEPHLPPFDQALLSVSRLALPFYRRRDEAGAQSGLDLYEIAIPERIDGLGLQRWCFFLWDGGNDLRGIDWLSGTLHDVNAQWGFDAGESDAARLQRLDLYLRLFCAFVNGDDSDLGIATPFMLVDPSPTAGDGDPLEAAARTITLARAEDGTFATRALTEGADPGFRVSFGNALFKGRFRMALAGNGRIDIAMEEDEFVAATSLAQRPLYVRRWSSIAFLCRGNLPAAALRTSPEVFCGLLASPHTVAAIESGRRPVARGDASSDVLAYLARAAWGGPATARPKLEIDGTVAIGSPGRALGSRLWLSPPPSMDVEILGDLDFEARRFRSPVELRRITMRGVLRGRDARFESALVLESFTVRNELPIPAAGGGNPFAPPTRSFPPVAVQLDAMRCSGDVSLANLRATGTVSLERANIHGQVSLGGGDYRRNSADSPALRADHMAVRASLEITNAFCRGGMSLKDLRVLGSVDLSGCVVTVERHRFKGGYWEDGIHLDRSHVGGDLTVNRQHHCTTIDDMVPALIGGDLDLSQVEVQGSVEIVCVQVNDSCKLDGARIGRELVIAGLRYMSAPPTEIAHSPLADLTIIRNGLSLANARIGARLFMGAVCVGGTIEAIGLQADVVQMAGSGAYRLPVVAGTSAGSGANAADLRLSRARLGSFMAEAPQVPRIEARDLLVRGVFRLTAGTAWLDPAWNLSSATDAIFRAWGAVDANAPPDPEAPAPADLAAHRNALRDHLRKLERPASSQPLAARIQTGIVVNNLRTRADVVLESLITPSCEVADCTIGGDLRIGGGALPCGIERLHLTGNGIEGRVDVGRTANRGGGEAPVERLGDIDLSYTHARRGLGVGADNSSVEATTCNLTGFVTEADADLSGLVLALPGADARGASSRRRPFGWWRRIWLDLTDRAEATAATADGLAAGRLQAAHARVGGRLSLPTRNDAIETAWLPFLNARSLRVAGGAFRDAGALHLALDASNARIDSLDLCEPLPQRANLQNCEALRWEVTPGRDCGREERAPDPGRDASSRYVELLDRSWPFAQDVYARLERDYRDFGEQRIADVFLRRMGWRLWRWSYLRPVFQSRPAQLLLGLGAALAAGAAMAMPQAVTALAGVPAALRALLALFALLLIASVAPGPARDALRCVVGIVVVAPLQLVYGFGVRWWMPLMVSAALLVFVTWPMLQDCGNLAVPSEAPVVATPHGDGSCRFAAAGETVTWTSSEAFWRAVQYHVPIIPLEGFYHGEIQERVRPVGAGTPQLRGRPITDRPAFRVAEWIPGVRWLFASPERYARFIHLTSWLVVPFSLVFFAGRLQRKYRLQQG